MTSEAIVIKKLKKHSDPRGWFAEIIKKEDLKKKTFGQISVATAKAHQDRGGHYHKIRYEWFVIIKGSITISLHHTITGEKREIILSEETMETVLIPPLWFHEIKNSDNTEAIMILYSSIPYDSKNPDVYSEFKK